MPITGNYGSNGLYAASLNIGSNNPIGAGIKLRNSQYYIQEYTVNAYDAASKAIALSAVADRPIGWGFYLDGKLWMLDQPGEWVQENGRLYAWMPDGKPPTNIEATPVGAVGINAHNATGITLDGIAVKNSELGIDASATTSFVFKNGSVSNSYNYAIDYAASSGATLDNLTITNSGVGGIWGDGDKSLVTNNVVRDTGFSGNPRGADAGITVWNNSVARGNTVIDSAYQGVWVQTNSVLDGNTVDGACLVFDDCGGIYTSGKWGTQSGVLGATYSRILNNTVTRVTGNMNGKPSTNRTWAYGIFLDDFASWVNVSGNTITNTQNGLLTRNGHDNVIENNMFDNNLRSHIFFSQNLEGSDYSTYNNIIRNNTMGTSRDFVYELWNSSAGDITKFATYSNNVYLASKQTRFAEVADYGVLSWTRWQQVMSDTGSTLK